jgi:hypothetical protein
VRVLIVSVRGGGETVDSRVIEEHDLHVLLQLLNQLCVDLLSDLACLLVLALRRSQCRLLLRNYQCLLPFRLFLFVYLHLLDDSKKG